MSRQKKQENPIVLLLFWLLGLLLLIFTVLASFIILVGWLACEMLYRSHPRTPSENDILLDGDERQALADIDAHIFHIKARLAEIEAEGQHLRKRKDGLFHTGSRLGGQLNAEISELLLDLSDSQAIRHELLSRPDERLRGWVSPLSRLIAFRWAVATYLICILYALVATPSSVIYMNKIIFHWLSTYFPPLSVPVYGGMALASIVASCTAGAAYLFYSRKLHNHYAQQLPSLS